ncbi:MULTISPECIES: hypothetical protein [Streptomyces]|uniref:Uncharacterized protein n=1 Tax=Streptomyces yunnanensis TaxID=156453 RepID=A0ABY8AL03_9ACTN|nr:MULTISPECIES: hypothetical protein [Streptomyces]AJC52738.1 hypothetical protein GZL_00130 [Streptomyces sp. 769]WEB37950.1 hypothetical protein MOV08_00525 [Streptomyces yunnanensis]WEB45469.1 hypothetical protein MOV08_43435 [Streptomyces yunnanensis]
MSNAPTTTAPTSTGPIRVLLADEWEEDVPVAVGEAAKAQFSKGALRCGEQGLARHRRVQGGIFQGAGGGEIEEVAPLSLSPAARDARHVACPTSAR